MPNRRRPYWLLLAHLAYLYNPDQGASRSSLAARKTGSIVTAMRQRSSNQITKNTIASIPFPLAGSNARAPRNSPRPGSVLPES